MKRVTFYVDVDGEEAFADHFSFKDDATKEEIDAIFKGWVERHLDISWVED